MTAAATNKINLEADDLLECILKRKGGTVVEFGFHNKKKVKYHFQPLNPLDPDSPHICNVPNLEHYKRLVSITEAYREFDPDGEYEQVYAIQKSGDDSDFDGRNDYEDLLSVNPEEVSNDWLAGFTQQVLQIKLTQKQKLTDYAKTSYGIEVDKTVTAADLARLILVACIEEEREASENT